MSDHALLTLLRWEKDGTVVEQTADGFTLPMGALTPGETIPAELEISPEQSSDLIYAQANRLTPIFACETPVSATQHHNPTTRYKTAIIVAITLVCGYLLPIVVTGIIAAVYAVGGTQIEGLNIILVGLNGAAVANIGTVVILPRVIARMGRDKEDL